MSMGLHNLYAGRNQEKEQAGEMVPHFNFQMDERIVEEKEDDAKSEDD